MRRVLFYSEIFETIDVLKSDAFSLGVILFQLGCMINNQCLNSLKLFSPKEN